MRAVVLLAMLLVLFTVSAKAQYTEKWATQINTLLFLDAGNTDADPQLELLFASEGYSDSLVLIDGLTGQVEWIYVAKYIQFTSTFSGGPHLEDVDNDGVDEILFSTNATQSPGINTYIRCYDSDVSLGIDTDNSGLPESIELSRNYPNPFNPSTIIEYSVPRKSHVTITIFNMLGQKLADLVNEEKSPGKYSVEWNGTDRDGKPVASGVYFYALRTDDEIDSKKMLLLK